MQAKIYLALAGRLVTLLTPRNRTEGKGKGKGKTPFFFARFSFKTVQYGCFCLKIPEIVADIYIGTVQTSARENIS